MFTSAPTLLSVTTDPTNSDVATAHTISWMQRISYQYSNHPLVLQAVRDAIQGLPSNSEDRDYARAIFYWIKGRVNFSDDESIILNGLHRPLNEYGTDLLITPDALLGNMPTAIGDCDDYSMLGASMLIALGMHPKFVTVAANPHEPHTFSHVYVVVYLKGGERMVLDFSHGSYPGWEFNKATRIQEW